MTRKSKSNVFSRVDVLVPVLVVPNEAGLASAGRAVVAVKAGRSRRRLLVLLVFLEDIRPLPTILARE